MNKLLPKLFLFVVGFLITFYFFIIFNNSFLKEKEDYRRKFLQTKSKDIKGVILGDSHAAVLPEYLSEGSIYNLAYGGDSVYEMLLKLEMLLRNGSKINKIILSCEWYNFADYREKQNNKHFMKALADEDLYKSVYSELMYSSYWARMLSRCLIFDNNIYVLKRNWILGKIKNSFRKEKDVEINQQLWMQLSRDKKKEMAHERAKQQLSSIMSPNLTQTFEKILHLCKDKGIQVIGIRLPLTQEYLEEAKNYDIQASLDYYAQLSISSIFDYTSLIKEEKFFTDSDHVNDQGAAIVVEQLLKDIELVRKQ